MELEFAGEIWFWRGPSPFYFITVPEDECVLLHDESKFVTYGWGMIPVTARIGRTSWKTSLFPRDGRYIVPIKVVVRRAEHLDEGDAPVVHLTVRMP
ncbi:MAG: hypothetical protein JWN39_3858 [Ilumatobacteraceae bacterium]|nr:hypothetical protein [Ilumatobacteraceae bacterium]